MLPYFDISRNDPSYRDRRLAHRYVAQVPVCAAPHPGSAALAGQSWLGCDLIEVQRGPGRKDQSIRRTVDESYPVESRNSVHGARGAVTVTDQLLD